LLIDEDEFQVSPAITRQVSLFEFQTSKKSKRAKIEPPRPNSFDLDLSFVSGNTQLSEVFRYTADINVGMTQNVSSFSVTINGNYAGDDLSKIQINDGDTLIINVIKNDINKIASIKTIAVLV
jgi:hypothetical protein